jgi:hypothetical protein
MNARPRATWKRCGEQAQLRAQANIRYISEQLTTGPAAGAMCQLESRRARPAVVVYAYPLTLKCLTGRKWIMASGG